MAYITNKSQLLAITSSDKYFLPNIMMHAIYSVISASTRASTSASTWVLACEYEYKYEYNNSGIHEYEYSTSTSNSVLEYCEYEYRVRVPQPWRRVGELLDVDMDDHDLSTGKSRIVQIALRFLWHWPSARQENEQLSHMKKIALDAVHAGHLEMENHHPEHEKVGVGSVDVYKLFADRLSVHLQKDVHDSQKGWGININFIPPQYRDEWSCFVSRYQTLDWYEASK